MIGPCQIRFGADERSPSWPAVAITGYWNGFAVPLVTPETRDAIAAWSDETEGEDGCGAEMRAIPTRADGLVHLNVGYAFEIDTPEWQEARKLSAPSE